MPKITIRKWGKNKTYYHMHVWNGEIKTKSIQIDCWLSPEELDDLEQSIKKARETISINGGLDK